jgi:hypothetical protein
LCEWVFCGLQGADLFFCKTFQADVMLTLILYDGVFYATLSDASTEQALVDTLFPNIYGRSGLPVSAWKTRVLLDGGWQLML